MPELNKQLETNDIKIKDIFCYFWEKLKPYKWMFVLCLVLSIIADVSDVYVSVYSSKIVDFVELDGLETSVIVKMLFGLLVTIAVLLVIRVLCNRMGWLLTSKFELSGINDIKKECFNYLHRHSYRFFSNNFSGGLVRKINKLSHSFESIVDMSMSTLLQLVITLPLTMVIIMKESILVGIIFIVFGVIYTVCNVWFTKNNLKYERQTNEQDSKLTGELSDTITNSFNIMTFASLKYESSKISKTLEDWRSIMRKKLTRMAVFFMGTNTLLIIFRISSIGACCWLRGQGEIPASVIILVQLFLGKFVSVLSSVEKIFKDMNRVLGESAEMLAILKTPHEIQDKTNKTLKIKEGEIIIQNVNFGYIPEDIIIENLNLSIKPGEKVAIVGESGSGKTTLVKLLFRFFDVRDGKILIDGQDISKVTQDSLRSQLSMVPQDALLFHRSIKENIAYAKPDVTDEEIIKVAKMAKCHDFIMNLPDKYDSLVGERGIKLSGGERQRIAIARAILENAKVLVLDEATSSLDSESEYLIQLAMDEVMKGKTAIVIAHRLSTIMKMDRIVVMDEGVIVEEGTHEELVKKKDGVYHKLWAIQSGGFITKNEGDKMNFIPEIDE